MVMLAAIDNTATTTNDLRKVINICINESEVKKLLKSVRWVTSTARIIIIEAITSEKLQFFIVVRFSLKDLFLHNYLK